MSDIYYEITYNNLSEYIDTENPKLIKYLEDARKYYKLEVDEDILGGKIYKVFKIGDFILYLLNIETSFDDNIDAKITLIKKYINQCISNNKYFKKEIFLAFLRDVLGIAETPNYRYFASDYYTNEDIDKEINKKDIEIKIQTFNKNKKNIKIMKEYICKDILDFIIAAIYEVVSNCKSIHRCINCGRLFLRNSKDKTSTRYCNHISPQKKTKTCFEYRKKATASDIRKDNPIYDWNRKISDTLRTRKTRANENNKDTDGNDSIEEIKCKEELEKYQEWYKMMKKIYKNQEISKEEFTILLKEKHEKYIKEWEENGRKRNNKK